MDFEQVIQELQQLHGSSTRVPGFRKRSMVDGEKLAELVDALKAGLPHEMMEAQEVIRQKDSILNQAYLESQRLKSDAEDDVSAHMQAAQQEHESKVDESEIVRAAEVRAQEIRDAAMVEAQDIVQDAQKRAYRTIADSEDIATSRRDGADQYAREVLFSLEEQLSEVLGQVRRGIDSLPRDAEYHAPEIAVPA
ncbi:MAG: hypothetical protein QGG34_08600 [SAR202 cluster bacterium]|nr:hypothetical protein [SAR202 cluster bacterium]MDP6301102.1 hypothetical protein [SAR202 cluster bacterium]MDP7104800.1 hypothetical protein [SAR202 cluster bacterium]MDP7225286.1 hypothetical protein [SAR202 cluster bacterium]MDP7413102.1 hypothetical protein [SAR202 cluster bacterium]